MTVSLTTVAPRTVGLLLEMRPKGAETLVLLALRTTSCMAPSSSTLFGEAAL